MVSGNASAGHGALLWSVGKRGGRVRAVSPASGEPLSEWPGVCRD